MKGICLLLSLAILGLLACSKKIKKAHEEMANTTEEKVQQFAKRLYQNEFEIIYNSSKTVACIAKNYTKKPHEPLPTLSFTLYHPGKEKILFKETIPRAKGTWIDEEQFEVTVLPERVGRAATLEKKQGYLFNITTLEKRKF